MGGFDPAGAESSSDLVNLLEKKGALTKEEAESLRKDQGIFSLRGGKVKFGGELELEFIKSENNSGAKNNPDTRLAIDKVVLTAMVFFTNKITFKTDIQISGDGESKVDKAWVKFAGLPGKTWITVGLDNIFMKPHRKTEAYPILGFAFWQDEDLGVQAGGELHPVYWRASLTNGRHLKDRRITEDDTFPIATDDDDNVENNSNKTFGIGIGIDHKLPHGQRVDILPFYYTATLSDDDLDYLTGRNPKGPKGPKGIITYPVSDDDDKNRFGINLEYLVDPFTFFAQYIQATDGKMDRDGWYIQPSYKLKFKERKTLTGVELLLRYEQYNVDLDRDPDDSRTWDRQTTTFAVIADIVKNLKVKAEYLINDEDTGNGDVDNDEFVVQLEARF